MNNGNNEYDDDTTNHNDYFENDEKNRTIDISIRINNDIYIGIENKISRGALQKTQFREEYGCIRNSFKYSRGKKVIMVMLAPNEKGCFEVFKGLTLQKNDKKAFITWEDVCNIILEILEDERNCIINPIMDYTKMTLRAFVYYIKNINEPVFMGKVEVVCSNKEKYTICQLSNGKVYIKENEDLIVKHLIFDVLHQLDPKIWYDFDKQKYDFGPRSMGDRMFELLNGENSIKLKENIVFCSDKLRKKKK